MRLRNLEIKDAEKMLSWMKDLKVNCFFRFDSSNIHIEDCINFIEKSKNNNSNLHLAIVNDDDEYMGTISLKNIDSVEKSAEYAIVICRENQGKGIAKYATIRILDIAFNRYKLNTVYLNVLENNIHAKTFYEKFGFLYEGKEYNAFKRTTVNIQGKEVLLDWYSISKEVYNNNYLYWQIDFHELGDERGKLVVAESFGKIPFNIKRIFYIYGSDYDVIRGQHANKNSEFVLINVAGSCEVKVDTGKKEQIFYLNKPNKGLYINKMVWKDMYNFSKDSVLLVLSNTVYDAKEYIRDYDTFKNIIKEN